MINYEIDSEDELDDMMGENLNSGSEESFDSSVQSLVDEGFIVADDYLSDSECNSETGDDLKERYIFARKAKERQEKLLSLSEVMTPKILL